MSSLSKGSLEITQTVPLGLQSVAWLKRCKGLELLTPTQAGLYYFCVSLIMFIWRIVFTQLCLGRIDALRIKYILCLKNKISSSCPNPTSSNIVTCFLVKYFSDLIGDINHQDVGHMSLVYKEETVGALSRNIYK